jgi:hypothetical protein
VTFRVSPFEDQGFGGDVGVAALAWRYDWLESYLEVVSGLELQ